ncbi:MAG: CAP domain-containing protein [Polyangiaceae bacterium]
MVGLALVALCAGGCSDEDDGDAPPPLTTNGGSGGSADTSPTAGSSGSAGDGASNGGTGGGGGNADAGPTDDGEDEPEPANGETGLFVGATAAHNAIREQVSDDEGIQPALPDLTWSNELALVAQDWANTLTSEDCGSIAHRPNGRLGENIAARGSRGISLDPMPPDEAVQGWADEVECWTYGRITGGNPNVQGGEQCEPQCIASKNSTGCGHYTQLVWANTRQVGCGYSTCTTEDDFLFEVWVCNYDPPGNVISQFPYQPGN